MKGEAKQMNKYIVVYRQQGQMGWDKQKRGSVKANSAEEAKEIFENWAKKPSQYRHTLIKIYAE